MRSLSSLVLPGLFAGSMACSAGGGTAENATGSTGLGGGTSASGTSAGSGSVTGGGGSVTGGGGALPGLGAATFEAGELDPASNGATITFEDIGAPGWFPSIRDPAGTCDVVDSETCCLQTETITSDALTPWDRDLIMTLRGPINVKQLAVYQPDAGSATTWRLASAWDSRVEGSTAGISFDGNALGLEGATPFAGQIGSKCLVNVATDDVFPCGPGSSPYCKQPPADRPKHYGWAGSKLIVLLAGMPRADGNRAAASCSETTDGWHDAPWIGLSLGELIRAGAFSGCQCYAKDRDHWERGDGCGQFNAFEVVNDHNSYTNLDLFSTSFFGYAGYVGEGPCGSRCDVSGLGSQVDLIDTHTSAEAAQGAVSRPGMGPGAAFRRPEAGYRYFLILLDVSTRTVQLGVIHPEKIPAGLAPILPDLPGAVDRAAIDGVLQLRLPR